MDNGINKEFAVYNDIQARTDGEIYIGIVGPVRTGKSTFIKRFMDLEVIPKIEDENIRERTIDELPQSGNGTIITTTEPKFIPKEAALINIKEGLSLKIKFIDCVGYVVEGAKGTHDEHGRERMVKTPWFDYDIPFTKAAKMGTMKVINNHSTIGIVITSDGSIGELPREAYKQGEAETIKELKLIGKPFIVIVNSKSPYSKEAKQTVKEIESLYNVNTMALNCDELKKEDIYEIFEKILYEFPVTKVEFYMPKWVEALSGDHKVKGCIINYVKQYIDNISLIRDAFNMLPEINDEFVKEIKLENADMGTGVIRIRIHVDEKFYYENISELAGTTILGEYQLISMIKEMSRMKNEYEKVGKAMESVRQKGYGIVMPRLEEITLDEPSIIKHGNKYGVRIKAESPSIHLIKANIETEISPIVGNEAQARDLINYINEGSKTAEGIWKTNIFGKTIENLVEDGINNKISMMNDESQVKLQETMEKVVNDNNGGMVCIIL